MKYRMLLRSLAIHFLTASLTEAQMVQPEYRCLPDTVLRKYQQLLGWRNEYSSRTDNHRFQTYSSYSGHPLDPLSANEIEKARDIINYCLPVTTFWIFNTITLREPDKKLLAAYFYKNQDPPPGLAQRQAFCIVKQNGATNFIEVVVNLEDTGSSIVSKKTLGAKDQSIHTTMEYNVAKNVCFNNPEFIKRSTNLGYSLPRKSVHFDQWSMAYVEDNPRYKGKELFQMTPFGMKFLGDNIYAHPFPFTVVVDLVQQVVIDFLDVACRNDLSICTNTSGVTVPAMTANYDKAFLPKDFYRKDVKPIKISFPKGTSYTASGNLIKWQKFSFRIGFNLREGLVINLVSYNDSGTVRPLVYRAAISEMWIPYGDPRLPTGPRKAVFDEGEYGLGFFTSILNADQDCVGGSLHDITFFDGVVHTETGEPLIDTRAVCIREEDDGVLWRHTNQETNVISMARSRRLAVTFLVRSGNYEYYFHWRFYQDASIQLDIQLSGCLNTYLLALGSPPPPYGSQLSDQVIAQYHQHLFCARIDADFDGPLNSISTVDMVADPQPLMSQGNYYGNGIIARVVLLNTMQDGVTDTNHTTSRNWRITNENSLHPVTNKPVGWTLKPNNSPPPIWNQNSPAFDRARFASHAMWVTPYKEGQLYAAGAYLNGNGLPQWVEKDPNADIVNKDIVLWHVFGVTHNPRIEDWPVMPVESTGFWLKPYYFFNQNPGLDVPILKPKCMEKTRNKKQ